MFAEIQLNYLNERYEAREHDLLGSVYAEHDNVTGNYQTVSTESLAIDLAELSKIHDKKMKPFKKDIIIFNETLKLFNKQDQSNLYYAINNQDAIFKSNESQSIVMRFGLCIEGNHHTEINDSSRKERNQYLNKLISQNNIKLVGT